MGGMSYKCPVCNSWFLSKAALKSHVKDAHGQKNIEISGTGPHTYLKNTSQRKKGK